MRRRPSATFLRNLEAHVRESAISSIRVGEVVFGALRISNGDRYLEYLHEVVLPRLPVLAVDVAVASRSGSIRSDLARSGRIVPDLDLLIAAATQTRELTVDTRDVRRLERVPAIHLADWFTSLPR